MQKSVQKKKSIISKKSIDIETEYLDEIENSSNMILQNNYTQKQNSQIFNPENQSANVIPSQAIYRSSQAQQNDNMKGFINNSKNQAQVNQHDQRSYVQDISKSPYNCLGKIVASFNNEQNNINSSRKNKIIPMFTKRGVGGIISQNIIITSAHTIYDKETKKMADKVQFQIENQDKDGKRNFIRLKVIKTFVHPTYISSPYQKPQNHESRKHDMALLILENNKVIKSHQILKIKQDYSFNKYSNNDIIVLGYKMDPFGQSKLAKTSQKAFQQDNQVLKYKHTTDGGYSGGPVLIQQINSKKQISYSIIGIHKGHIYNYNYCILLSKITNPKQSLRQFIQSLGLENELQQNFQLSKNYLIKQYEKLQYHYQILQQQNYNLDNENNLIKKELQQKKKLMKILQNKFSTNKQMDSLRKIIRQFEVEQMNNQRTIKQLQQKIRQKNIYIDQLKRGLPSSKRFNTGNVIDNGKYKSNNKSQESQSPIRRSLSPKKRQKTNHKAQNSSSKLIENQQIDEESIEQAQSQNKVDKQKMLKSLTQNKVYKEKMLRSQQLKDLKAISQNKIYKQEIQNQQNRLQLINGAYKSFCLYFELVIKRQTHEILLNRQLYIKNLIRINENSSYTNEQLSLEYSKRLKKNKDNTYQLYLSSLKFKMKNFVKYNWRNLNKITLIACEIDDNQWNLFVNNLESFPHLKYLQLYRNRITTVTKNQLQKFKTFKKIYVWQETNKLTSQSIKNLQNFKKMNPQIQLSFV